MGAWRLKQQALAIRHGAVFAYPTDTIWGLGCLPASAAAVHRIVKIKRRPLTKGLILLSSSIDYCHDYIDADFYCQHYPQISQPAAQPTTWLIPAGRDCPDWLNGGSDRIAIRLTRLAHIGILCDTLQAPLVSTSANISGRRPARNSYLIHKQFQAAVDFIIDGIACPAQQASRIIDLQSGTVLRP